MASTHNKSNFIWPYVQPPLYEPLWFEKFDVIKCRDWMEENWTISLYICGVYMFLVIISKQFMKNKAAYDLRKTLAVWNFAMAIFSVVGFLRCLPELLYVLRGTNGFHRSICVRDNHNEAAAFWAWAFTLSKVVQLGDTAFIILRKKQLQFVHYYHHSVALVVCWCYYSDYEPIARYFGILNFASHSILYFYLFLKTIGTLLPRFLAKCIIMIELGQMILGICVNLYALWAKAQGIACERSMAGIQVQMVIYGSFVVIFVYLFDASGSVDQNRLEKKKSL